MDSETWESAVGGPPAPDAEIDRLDAMALERRPEAAVEIADLLRRHPGDARVHAIQGEAAAALGHDDTALRAYDAALALDPGNAQALFGAGRLLSRMGRNQDAFDRLRAASALRGDAPEIWRALGVAAAKLKRWPDAVEAFAKTVEREPQDVLALSNLGLALERSDRAAEARAMTGLAVALSRGEPVCALRHGTVLTDTGSPREGLVAMSAAFRRHRANGELATSFMMLAAQLPEVWGEAQAFWAQLEGLAAGAGDPICRVAPAIGSALCGRWDAVARAVTGPSAREIEAAILAAGGEPRARGAHAFLILLNGLAKARGVERLPEGAAPPLFHIGESHCLSFAQMGVDLGGARHRIEPRLVLGAKALHFGQARETGPKAVFERHLATIPGDAPLLLSFGEIDCRLDEGILHHRRKSGGDLREIAERTVEGYVSWLAERLAGRAGRTHLMGVPAATMEPSVAAADQAAQREVIAAFNGALAEGARAAGFGFVDLHAITADETGASHGRLQCDGRHLSPAALLEVGRMLNGA
ncbi:MAG: tetratricopeptide repeat protein [Pseudomonadota bacterium]